jgi:hypothetical protein
MDIIRDQGGISEEAQAKEVIKMRNYYYITYIQSKSPINPVAGLWGFYSLLLTRLLSHSVKTGYIPIYIGIKFDFVLCESIVRWTLSSHNNPRNKIEYIYLRLFLTKSK